MTFLVVPCQELIEMGADADKDQTDEHYPTGGTRACLGGKRKGIQRISRNTSGKSKCQGKKKSYIRETSWKCKLVTNSISLDNRIWVL